MYSSLSKILLAYEVRVLHFKQEQDGKHVLAQEYRANDVTLKKLPLNETLVSVYLDDDKISEDEQKEQAILEKHSILYSYVNGGWLLRGEVPAGIELAPEVLDPAFTHKIFDIYI